MTTPAPAPAPTAGSTTTTAPVLPSASSNIILPTDTLPLTAGQDKVPFGENLQLRINQMLPARFYFSSSVETSLRFETNPFQYPRKSILARQLPQGPNFLRLPANQQFAVQKILRQSDSQDNVFRILPNVTGGWTITPRTRIFANYFMIRDQLAKNITLNTVIHSYAWGLQQDIPLAQRANLQAEIQFRELNQMHQQSVFDFLPGLTLSYIANPKTVLFANALLQMRGKKYFQGPTKEIDPFYTFGALHSRGGWTFAASSTIVQNFREPFRGNATIPVNNYAIISDFEIARRLFKQVPGLQGFIRAEPIFNFHSNNRPGLSGIDFRLFYGLRMAVAKPALTATINNIIEQLRNQEGEPQGPGVKPSAYLPEQVIAGLQQQIHGSMDGEGDTDAIAVKPAEVPPDIHSSGSAAAQAIADAEAGAADSWAGAATPADPASLDWKPIVSNLADEKDFTLSEIHERIDDSTAQSTSTAYDTTAKRTDLLSRVEPTALPGVRGLPNALPNVPALAQKTQQPPQIELAKANWDKLAATAQAQPEITFRTDSLAGALETQAAQSSQLTYEQTAKHSDLLVAHAPQTPGAAPTAAPTLAALKRLMFGHEHVGAVSEEAPMPELALEAAKPLAIAHERGSATSDAAWMPEIAHTPEPSRPLTIAHEKASATGDAAAMPEIAHAPEPARPLTIAHEKVSATSEEAPMPEIAHAPGRVEPTALLPTVDLDKGDWTQLVSTAHQIQTNDTAFDGGILPDLISAGAAHSTTYGAEQTAHRIASLAHASPPPEPIVVRPTPRIHEVAAIPPPVPLPASANQITSNAPATPAPSRLSASLPEQAKPLPIAPAAAAESELAAPPAVAMHKPSLPAPAIQPVAPVLSASIPRTAVPAPMHSSITGQSTLPPPIPPALTAEPSTAASAAATAPAPITQTTNAAAPQPAPLAVTTSSPPAPIPQPLRAKPATSILASLPPAVAPPAPVMERKTDLLAAANWDSLAKIGSREPVVAWQYLGELRETIESAANQSARTLDYTVLNNSRDKVRLAAKTPPRPAQAAKPANPVMMVPMQTELTPPSITSDRRGEEAADGNVAVDRHETAKPTGWHPVPSRTGHVSKVDMHIVPPLPTVRLRGKENPFKGTGIDLKKPLMLSIPH